MPDWTDTLVPRRIRTDPDRHARFRAGMLTLLANSVALALFTPLYALIAGARAQPETAVLLAMALNPLLGMLLAYASGRITVGVLAANQLGLVGIGAVCWFTGGAASFALCWYLPLLSMAASYGNRPLLLASLGTTTLLLGGLVAAGRAGLLPPFRLPQEQFAALQSLFIASALGLVAWSSLLAVRARQRSSARLRAALAEASSARAAAEAADRARGDFLSMISHELRTPMNGILGGTQLLAEAALPAPERAQLAGIDTSARRLLTLLDALLDFTRLNAGATELHRREIALQDLLGEAVALQRAAADARRLDLVLENRCGALRLRTDPGAVRTILLNLLGNAVKFTDYGRITLVAMRHEDSLRFEVHDSGPGIEAGTPGELFEPFRQADGSLARRHEGAGLGLATCKRLVELLGGRIDVVSLPGMGSIFWFEIPLEEVAPPVAEVPAARTVAAHPRGHGSRRVLLVEDNAVNQHVAKVMLQRLGCVVSVAGDGREALEQLGSADFDLVLMDIQMPELDGVEATRRIRAGDARVRDIPIIALTANVMAEQRAGYIAAGMDGVVAKPIELPVLARTLEAAFAGRAKD